MKLREIKLTPPIVAISAMFLVLTGSVRAEIPTTLEPGTSYVVNCETGDAPAKIYVENASLTLENKAHLDFTKTTAAATKEGGGTNFLLRVAGGSVVTNYQGAAPTSNSRIVVDGGSTFSIDTGNNVYLPKAETVHDVVIAVTNSFFYSKYNLHFCGYDGRYLFKDSTFNGGGTTYVKGHDNVLSFAGQMELGSKSLSISGASNWFRVEDNTQAVFGNGGTFSGSEEGTNTIYVGKNSYLYIGGSTGLKTNSRNTRIIVDDGGCINEVNGDAAGMFGWDAYWITTNGTFAVSNNAYRIACPSTASDMDVHVEFYGPKANLYGKNLYMSSATYPSNLTVRLRPGPTGFASAPIYSPNTVGIYGGLFDIDMREALQQVEPGEVFRLPVAQAGGKLDITDLEKLNADAKLLPEDAQLVKDGKILYCVARRQKGLMILVR